MAQTADAPKPTRGRGRPALTYEVTSCHIRLPVELVAELEDAAKTSHQSRTAIVSQALREWLARREKKAQKKVP